jgi:DNA repair protein RadA
MKKEPLELEQIKALSKDIIGKLERKGITTLQALATFSIADLTELGLDEPTARQALRETWEKTGFGFIPAQEIEKIRPKEFLTTGCKTLDTLLGGGILTREITELIGEYGTGKTQTEQTILTENLGSHPDWRAIYLDTEMTFTIARVREIAKARGYDPEDIIKRIITVNAPASEQLLLSVDELPRLIKENVKLVFLDSLVGTFRSEYVGRELLWYRQQLINKLLRKLLTYASIFNLAVVVSNQVVSRPSIMYSGDIVEQNPPTGGHIVAHGCATRIYFRKAGASKRIAELIDSAWRPHGEAILKISEKGIEDLPQEKQKEGAET